MRERKELEKVQGKAKREGWDLLVVFPVLKNEVDSRDLHGLRHLLVLA